ERTNNDVLIRWSCICSVVYSSFVQCITQLYTSDDISDVLPIPVSLLFFQMADIPLDAPAECPGTQSDSAGKTSACVGCPNQNLCSSGQSKLTLGEREPEVIAQIRHRLNQVRYCIIILSGKGGVGKSSLSVCLARGLTRRMRKQSGLRPTDRGMSTTEYDMCNVGLLDLDLCGPSIPCMFGCMDEKVCCFSVNL
ncbi:uncharacterized protein DEA37_0012667, partial [Paragonimus westermani]